MPDQEFTQNIRVDGADEAKRKLDEVGEATEGVATETEKAGDSGKKTTTEFKELDSVLGDATQTAKSMIAGFFGFQAILQTAEKLLNTFKEIEEIQKRLSGKTVDFSAASQALRRQLGIDELEGIRLTGELMDEAGIEDPGFASQIGIQGSIEQGGGNLTGDKLEIAKLVAIFARAIDASGEDGAALFKFLKDTGNVGSPDDAMKAMAKIKASAEASRAFNTGEFMSLLLRGGGTMAQEGVPLEDILQMGGQVRQKEDAARAATTMEFLYRLATAQSGDFYQEMSSQASAQGLDISTMDEPDKVAMVRRMFEEATTQENKNRLIKMLSQEQGVRLLTAFGPANVDATRGVREQADNATTAAYTELIEKWKGEVLYRSNQTRARIQQKDAIAGFETALFDMAKETANAEYERRLASGDISAFGNLIRPKEHYRDNIIAEDIFSRITKLREAGALSESDVTQISGLKNLENLSMFKVGWNDEILQQLLVLVEQLEQRQSSSDRPINVTVIQHQQVDTGNGYESTYVDLPGD